MRSPLDRPIALGAMVALGVAMIATAGPASAETEVDAPDTFTSAFTVMATPDEVIDPDGNPADGAPGATGTFDFMVNSDLDIICYDITVTGAEPPYESMAKTATHIHEAGAGEAGPPRIAFPDPEGDGDTRTSSGCLQGPFTTGIDDDAGNDTGEGFTLAQLEDDPAGFAADTHTSQFVAGAVRGQLRSMPVGGVDTGQGGLAGASDAGSGTDESMLLMGLGLGGVLVAAGGVALRRRVRA